MTDIADTSDIHEAAKKLADDLRDGAKASPEGASAQAGGWAFAFTSNDEGLCTFSCVLIPPGRESIEQDWRFLGAVLGQIGAPSTAAADIIKQQIDNPNESLHTHWGE
jgi:hypothetical protein